MLIASAALIARKSVGLRVGPSDSDQNARLRKIISADPAIERVGHLLTRRLGPDSVLLTAAVRFQRSLNLDQVEQAIERLERAIKVTQPAVLHLYLESGALKQAALSSVQVTTHEPALGSARATVP